MEAYTIQPSQELVHDIEAMGSCSNLHYFTNGGNAGDAAIAYAEY